MNDYEKQIKKLVAANSLDVYKDIENELSEFADIRYSLKGFHDTLRNYCYDLNEEIVDKIGKE